MYILKENTFEIPVEDLRKILIISEDKIFQYIPKWTTINCKNVLNCDFSKPIIGISNLQNIFTSKEILNCSNLDKLRIQIGFFDRSEYISFKFLIRISLNKYLFQKIKDLHSDKKLSFYEIARLLSISANEIKLKLSRERLLDSLAHEISHFLDDSLHNNQIFKNAKKSISNDVSLDTVYNSEDINLSYMEINAQIHAIKNLKTIYVKQWDNLTIFDVIKKDASLLGLYRHFSDTLGKQKTIDWIKKLLKRMSRENLLGKNMTKIPTNDAMLMTESFLCNDYELLENCSIEQYLN